MNDENALFFLAVILSTILTLVSSTSFVLILARRQYLMNRGWPLMLLVSTT